MTCVTSSQLEVIAKVARPADQELLAKEVRDRGMSVRELELRAARMQRLRPIKVKGSKPKDCELKILVAMTANPYADCKECKIQGPCPD
ncbi:unnamed protein product, partial [marine sediment metagenome]